ncbi:MAG: TonB-dependent receptor plug domain-containing protein [Thermoanaerobaculia bacterium]
MRPFFTSLLCVLVLAAPLSAQDGEAPNPSEPDPPASSSDEEEEESPSTPAFGAEILVTASLAEQERRQATASAEVIDREQIEARGVTSVAELLSSVAGLDLVQSGGPGQQASLFTRGTESDHTLVLWNGIELNDPYFGGFNWAFLATDGIERVEVVRGPFSALYGSDALGGVVQILTRAPEGVRLRLEGGSDDYRRAGAAAGAELGPLQLEAYGYSRRGDGAFDNADFASDGGAVRADWQAGERLRVGLMARVDDSDTGIPFSGGLPELDRRIGWREEELALPVEAKVGSWQIEGSLARVDYASRYSDPDDPFGFTRSATDSEAWRARAVATRALGPPDGDAGSWIAFGGDWEEVEVDDSSVFGTNLVGASQSTRAAFTQWAGELGPVRLDLGLRHDDNSAYGGYTSPRAGVLWRLGDRHRVHASWGEGFRAPSVGELYFAGSGNPDLEPELSRGYELGWQHEHPGLSASVTGFENRLTDLIDFDFTTFTNVNVGRALTRGVEGSLAVERGIFGGELNATWTEAEDRDNGLALLRRPEWKGNLILTARPGDWLASLVLRYVGERPDVDAATFARTDNPSFVRTDLALTWRVTERLAPYVRVENAADEDYAPALGFPAPGRTWVAGVALDL